MAPATSNQLNVKALRKITAALLALSASLLAHGWGAEGHRLIAELAERQLTPAARSEVLRLLATDPGASMASVSAWADEIRSRETASWHYVNPPPGDCSYDQVRDCDKGKCVVEAINRQVAILGSKVPDSERLTALKWVIHLVGDAHQPLHAGFKSDKGGNLFQVQAFGRGTNMHSLWDSRLIRNRVGGLDALRASTTTAGVASPQPPQPSAWAIESCKVVLSPDFYPNSHFIDPSYISQWDSVLVARINIAAQRLAATLNETLR